MKWVWLIAGGILGTVGRYTLANAVYRWLGTAFPFGTLVVNTSGCFVIGWLAVLADKRFVMGSEARLFAMVGLLGAFTTFSSLIYESAKLMQQGEGLLAALNIFGSVGLGMLAFWLGSLVASVG